MIVSKIKILSVHPLEALLQLDKAARDGEPVVLMPADLRLDSTLTAPDGETLDPGHPDDAELIDRLAVERLDERRGAVRVVGPCSAGFATGPGDVVLVTAIGGAFEALVSRLGDELAMAIDIGLGWDLSAGELLGFIAAERGTTPTRFVLVVPCESPLGPEDSPPRLWSGLAEGLGQLAGRPVFALAHGPAIGALATHGVIVVDDRDALVETVRTKLVVRGTRVALVSALDGGARFYESALTDAGLILATPTDETVTALATELPRPSRLSGHTQIPKPTARHLVVARDLLSADPEVDMVWVTVGDPMDPLRRARLIANSAKSHTLTADACPLIAPSPENPRAHTHLMALRLMKRTALSRDEVIAALGPDVTAAPALAVNSLGAARAAARTLGFPVRLSPSESSGDGGILTNDDALTTAWESLLASLPSDSGAPLSRHQADPWQTRTVLVGAPTTRVTYTAAPLPTLRHAAGSLPLPARQHDLDAFPGATEALFAALGRIAIHHPEVQTLTLDLDASGRLIDASGALSPLLPTL